MYITLKCATCDNIECKLGRYVIPDDSEEGCTREVTEEQAELLQHYQEEVLPFIPMYKNHLAAQNKLEEIYQFLLTIYSCPLGKLINSKGKIILDPKIVDNRLNRESKLKSVLCGHKSVQQSIRYLAQMEVER